MAPSASLKVTGSPYLEANSIIRVMERSEQSRSLVDLRPGAFCVTYFRYVAYTFLLFPSQFAKWVQAAMTSLSIRWSSHLAPMLRMRGWENVSYFTLEE